MLNVLAGTLMFSSRMDSFVHARTTPNAPTATPRNRFGLRLFARGRTS
ncbi:hypothetical protein GR183_02945 [Stappia sp. GBMRC 2046]|uniref:Uncharacterized protein n=1 Tax=Stappia sediminis TaxID=2692190 RepID=A0A7X3LRP6_9HYPH|nr:hypothetical protein [Stappia sediminis]MXN63850.1 hypothetical protein [Stappia sediminis]